MTVIFPFYDGDVSTLERLLDWIGMLDGSHKHHAVLCADLAVTVNQALQVIEKARHLFRTARMITTEKSVSGWPQGPNSLFVRAARYVAQQHTGPWLWMETDAVPLRPRWLDYLEARYLEVGKPILGAIIPCSDPRMPDQHISGCAIYPENFYGMAERLLLDNPQIAFDIALAPLAIPMAAHDELFHCFWGEKNRPPKFSAVRQKPDEFTLEHLNEKAVLFHRNKDGSLIRMLRDKFFPGHAPPSQRAGDFVVVLPFCNKDAPLQISGLKWMEDMGQEPRYECLLSWDHSCIQPFVADMQQAARMVFRQVHLLAYPAPRTTQWPQAPNWAFQQVARYMLNAKRSWLFKEADMIALKPNWIEQLQEEYHSAGKLFMGSVVPTRNHCNGTAVFPFDVPARCPSAMKCIGEAFDTAMAKEMMPHCHNAIHLMQHVWGLMNGEPHPTVGQPIHFDTIKQVHAWVDPKAVTFHRVKDASLINLLRKERQELNIVLA